MVQIDEAETIALAVRDHDEVRILRVLIPINPAPAKFAHTVGRGLLFICTMHTEIEVDAGVVLNRCIAQLKGERGTLTAHRIESAPTVSPMRLSRLIVEQMAPEPLRAIQVVNAQNREP